ncbi:MFS transporter [Paenibacillus sp. LHD-117]|uniref:MFS transporter n=1 Tax=Paenibacillus sp. LHD-117 TaxID=3071412 RepID=UPI0027DFBF6C|nr:MFS transporter [Paenibacillus sp. LHD-117]MDQ6419369.1 MFS transporter [Paenibacillus sp. LHD-117]
MRIVSLYYFLLYLMASVLLPYTSLHFHERGFSPSSIGYLLSLWAFISVVAQPVMGMLNDRLQRPRAVLLLTAIATPAAGLLFYLADAFAVIVVVSILFAWFQSSLPPLSDAVAVEIGRRKGFSFGSVRLWGALSYAIGAFVTGFYYEKNGYDAVFVVYALTALPLIAAIFILPVTKAASMRITVFEQMGDVVRNKPFLLFCLISFLTMLSVTASATFLPIYFDEQGFDKRYLGTAIALAALIEVPMFWIAARLGAKFGKSKLLAAAAALYALKYIILSLTSNVYVTLSTQLLDGIAFAFFAGLSVEIVDGLASDKTKATLQTIFAAVTWGIGGIAGNLLGGGLVELRGVSFMYLLLFVLCGGSAVLYLWTKAEKSGKQLAGEADGM